MVSPPERVGETVDLHFRPVTTYYSGKPACLMSRPGLIGAVRPEGGEWKRVPFGEPTGPDADRPFPLMLESEVTHVAWIVPYDTRDLARLLERAEASDRARVTVMGRSVEGRELHMLEVGAADADSVFLRARAHPWETGGSWLLEGLVEEMLRPETADLAASVCFRLMPMAGMDGVVRGMSRFNVRGMDLNRGWSPGTVTDPDLAPENVCLMQWFEDRVRAGRAPRLAIDIHNDSFGGLLLAGGLDRPDYRERMARLERLLREKAWFREQVVESSIPETFANGGIERYDVDSLVWELNANWAEGLGRSPLHTDWMKMGAAFAHVAAAWLRGD